jgi:hypothetical protein
VSQKPAFARPPQRGNVVPVQADAVRAEPLSVQTVTAARARRDADTGAGASLLVDPVGGNAGYGADVRQPTPGERARAERVAPGASGLVSNHISAHRADRRLVRLEVGMRDVRIHRSMPYSGSDRRPGGGRRGKITSFSAASARRLLFCARNCPGLTVMVTLTYPREYPVNGRTVMDHWRRMRQWFARQGNPAGLWFKEFQLRGAPHFHVFLPNRVDKAAVALAWYSIVGSNDFRHLQAGTRTEALRNPESVGAYAAKYAAKRLQKEVPEGYTDVGRFWGIWGKPEITTDSVLRGPYAVNVIRMVRRGYQAKRKTWQCRRRFRDNGRSGFTGWDSGALAAKALQVLTASEPKQILAAECISNLSLSFLRRHPKLSKRTNTAHGTP